MIKWKMSNSWRKRKEKMKIKKMVVWKEEMNGRGIGRGAINLSIRGG